MPDQRTVANQINEYLAPVQPDDCRQANKALLIAALEAGGPVVHDGRRVSTDGTDVLFEDAPAETPQAAPAREAEAAPPPPPAPMPPTEARPAADVPLPEAPAEVPPAS